MADEFKRTEISRPGAPIREVRIEFPKHLKDAISESIDRGKRAGERISLSNDPPDAPKPPNRR